MIYRVLTIILCFYLSVFNTCFAEDVYSKDSTDTFIIGALQPIDTHEGVMTPLFFWDHKSYYDEDELSVNLKTVSLTAKMDHKLNETLHVGYGVNGTLLAESHGADLYVNGDRYKDETYKGDSASLFVFTDLRISDWTIGYQFKYKKAYFDDGEDTGDGFILPPDYRSIIHKIYLNKNSGFIFDEGIFEFEYIHGERDNLSNWSLDQDITNKKKYNRFRFKRKIPVEYSENNTGEFIFSGGKGYNLDLLNGFGTGGLASDFYVGGFYRNEYRVKEVISLNYMHEYHFESDRKLLLFADIARFEMVDLQYLDGVDRRQTISSAGIGFYYGIRSLGGLPVIIRYGEGFNIKEDSKESHRREIALVIVIKF
ncbi:MAG: hypothetical protein GY714_25670 [Desulfobacterales bacterium]|nr:hypothetical protein [Desulfobacterales bacterium]